MTIETTDRPPFILLTRFSVRILPFMKMARIEDEARREQWFGLRSKLFLSVTHPSLTRQTLRPDKWYLLMSVGDEALYERYVGLHDDWIVPVYLEAGETLGQRVRALLQRDFKDTPRVVLSRADNDDALRRNYVATMLESSLRSGVDLEHFVVTRWGCRWDGQQLQVVDYLNGPFISLYLPDWTRSETDMLAIQHTTILKYRHVVAPSDASAPMWLQTLHGANASNRFLPKFEVAPVDFSALQADFGMAADACEVIQAHREEWAETPGG